MSESKQENLQFHEFGLDDRLIKAIALLGWSSPTLIQEKAIPLALEGKDILARARTGSGKTAAYAIPVIQRILSSKQNAKVQCIKVIILTPTKELCNQACHNIVALSKCCSREVHCVDVSGQVALDVQKPLLMEKPDIVIGTPSRILAHLKAKNLNVQNSLEVLVVDEADLVFSFGYETDVKALLSHFPKIYQSCLMSATLSDDVKDLKKLILHNPVILKLQESQLPETSQLTQYHIKCEEVDKFTLIYTLLKLRLIRGKSIIFVNTVDKCYRLKLFLEQFGIRSCTLNSELPVNSRCHIVDQFNEGLYDIIIAADEVALRDPKQTKQNTHKNKRRKKDKEAGVSRGIDFQNVSNVVNFDFPPDVDSYIHRVGRTARADSDGTALSFVSVREMNRLEAVEQSLSDTHPPEVCLLNSNQLVSSHLQEAASIVSQRLNAEGENLFKPYNFKMEEIEGFKYRSKDAMRAVTKIAVREARLKEIKAEMIASQKLKSYFEDNPNDLQMLRHDKTLHTVKTQSHLKNVPDYIVPPTLRGIKQRKISSVRTGKSYSKGIPKGKQKYRKRKADPLKSFEFMGFAGGKKKKKK